MKYTYVVHFQALLTHKFLFNVVGRDFVLLGTFNARQADHRNGGQTRDRTQSEDGEGCQGNYTKLSFLYRQFCVFL